MPSKTINIKDSAYNALKSIKRKGESFSDVILRLTQREEGETLLDFLHSLPMEVRNEIASSASASKKELDTIKPREMSL